MTGKTGRIEKRSKQNERDRRAIREATRTANREARQPCREQKREEQDELLTPQAAYNPIIHGLVPTGIIRERQTGEPVFTEQDREIVLIACACGVPLFVTATKLGTDEKTLAQYFPDEINVGTADANLLVARTLFAKAVTGDTAAMSFWLKSRAGWTDRQHVTLSNPDGSNIGSTIDASKLSDETLAELMAVRRAALEHQP